MADSILDRRRLGVERHGPNHVAESADFQVATRHTSAFPEHAERALRCNANFLRRAKFGVHCPIWTMQELDRRW
jgi:hypothetical protein